jgi:hypothetical protein
MKLEIQNVYEKLPSFWLGDAQVAIWFMYKSAIVCNQFAAKATIAT